MKSLTEKYKGKSFAEVAKAIEKKYPNRKFDPLQRRSYEMSMQKLMSHQESVKAAKMVKDAMRMARQSQKMSSQLADAQNKAMGTQQPMQQQSMEMPQQGMPQQQMQQQMPQQMGMGGRLKYAAGGTLPGLPGILPAGAALSAEGVLKMARERSPVTPLPQANTMIGDGNIVPGKPQSNTSNSAMAGIGNTIGRIANSVLSKASKKDPVDVQLALNDRVNEPSFAGFEDDINKEGDKIFKSSFRKQAVQNAKDKAADFIKNDADAPAVIGKGINILGNALMLSKGYDKVSPNQNKYEEDVRRTMQSRGVDATAQRNALLSARNAALSNNSNYARSKNVQAAMNQNVEATTGSQMSQSLLQQDQMNEGFKAQLASTLNQLGQQRAQAEMVAEDLTARNKGVYQTNLSNFLTDLGDTGIDISKRKYSNAMNKNMADLISKKYADFGISQEYAEAYLSGKMTAAEFMKMVELSAAKNKTEEGTKEETKPAANTQTTTTGVRNAVLGNNPSLTVGDAVRRSSRRRRVTKPAPFLTI